MSWEQIFYNQNSIELQNKIREIADILADDKTDELSLFGGKAGNILFHAYYSKVFNQISHNNKIFESLDEIFEEIRNGFSFHTFSMGIGGIGWLAEFLQQNDFMDCDTNETIGDLDEYLYKLMIREIKEGNFDFLHGAGGLAFYFLKRITFSQSGEYISEFVDVLEQVSIKENNGIKWISETEMGNNKKRKVYNLGLSHGTASIIAILSKINDADINTKKTRELLNGAVTFLLSSQQDTDKYLSYFPGSVDIKGHKPHQSRLAWCYGDMGIAVALWHASQSMKNKEWENKAVEIILHSAKRRDLQENSVKDAGLCHGSAGIAHIFNRMYNYTGATELKNAATYWYKETLKMAKFEDGLAGYKAWRTKEYGGWTNEYDFLEGIAGIGLALISTISDTEPKWDECLLMGPEL